MRREENHVFLTRLLDDRELCHLVVSLYVRASVRLEARLTILSKKNSEKYLHDATSSI